MAESCMHAPPSALYAHTTRTNSYFNAPTHLPKHKLNNTSSSFRNLHDHKTTHTHTHSHRMVRLQRRTLCAGETPAATDARQERLLGSAATANGAAADIAATAGIVAAVATKQCASSAAAAAATSCRNSRCCCR